MAFYSEFVPIVAYQKRETVRLWKFWDELCVGIGNHNGHESPR